MTVLRIDMACCLQPQSTCSNTMHDPITYYLLPITYYLLPITYYLLPITYYNNRLKAPQRNNYI